MVHLPKTLDEPLKGKHLALDGRMRNKFFEAKEANLGAAAKEETHGDIFFAIERTQDKSKANLVLTYVEMPLQSSLTLPNGKKMTIALESSYLPDVPLLTNPEPILARTRLVALDDLALRNVMLKEEEARNAAVRKSAALAAQQAMKEAAAGRGRGSR